VSVDDEVDAAARKVAAMLDALTVCLDGYQGTYYGRHKDRGRWERKWLR
jgi:hypothetical protein